MKLAIVGYRNFNDWDFFCETVNRIVADTQSPDLIISGGATGVDNMAATYAKTENIELKEFLPNWSKYGKAARNTLIAEACDACIAFVSKKSVGTYDTIRKVKKLGKTVYEVEIDYCDIR